MQAHDKDEKIESQSLLPDGKRVYLYVVVPNQGRAVQIECDPANTSIFKEQFLQQVRESGYDVKVINYDMDREPSELSILNAELAKNINEAINIMNVDTDFFDVKQIDDDEEHQQSQFKQSSDSFTQNTQREEQQLFDKIRDTLEEYKQKQSISALYTESYIERNKDDSSSYQKRQDLTYNNYDSALNKMFKHESRKAGSCITPPKILNQPFAAKQSRYQTADQFVKKKQFDDVEENQFKQLQQIRQNVAPKVNNVKQQSNRDVQQQFNRDRQDDKMNYVVKPSKSFSDSKDGSNKIVSKVESQWTKPPMRKLVDSEIQAVVQVVTVSQAIQTMIPKKRLKMKQKNKKQKTNATQEAVQPKPLQNLKLSPQIQNNHIASTVEIKEALSPQQLENITPIKQIPVIQLAPKPQSQIVIVSPIKKPKVQKPAVKWGDFKKSQFGQTENNLLPTVVDEIQKLKIKSTQYSNSKGRLPDELMCPICLYPFSKAITLQCGHSFCQICLFFYSTMCNDKRCPQIDFHYSNGTTSFLRCSGSLKQQNGIDINIEQKISEYFPQTSQWQPEIGQYYIMQREIVKIISFEESYLVENLAGALINVQETQLQQLNPQFLTLCPRPLVGDIVTEISKVDTQIIPLMTHIIGAQKWQGISHAFLSNYNLQKLSSYEQSQYVIGDDQYPSLSNHIALRMNFFSTGCCCSQPIQLNLQCSCGYCAACFIAIVTKKLPCLQCGKRLMPKDNIKIFSILSNQFSFNDEIVAVLHQISKVTSLILLASGETEEVPTAELQPLKLQPMLRAAEDGDLCYSPERRQIGFLSGSQLITAGDKSAVNSKAVRALLPGRGAADDAAVRPRLLPFVCDCCDAGRGAVPAVLPGLRVPAGAHGPAGRGGRVLPVLAEAGAEVRGDEAVPGRRPRGGEAAAVRGRRAPGGRPGGEAERAAADVRAHGGVPGAGGPVRGDVRRRHQRGGRAERFGGGRRRGQRGEGCLSGLRDNCEMGQLVVDR